VLQERQGNPEGQERMGIMDLWDGVVGRGNIFLVNNNPGENLAKWLVLVGSFSKEKCAILKCPPGPPGPPGLAGPKGQRGAAGQAGKNGKAGGKLKQ
jgi:hypothetical protein